MIRRKIRDESEDESEGEETQYNSNAFKRPKVNNDAGESSSSAPMMTDDSSPSENLEENDEPLEVGEDGFVEGSIVKIVLTNFVTYDYCEIYPGPQMNMIIGPNGTGKSTIVCAIALGLGGAPSLLGRAKNIAEFVKTGQDEATIEIELKRVSGRNVLIQRNLKRQNNGTSWKLNGKTSTQKDVMAIVNKFNIQVDNLCQFLPQDRVAEFAELSPTQLLERTQSATGKSDLHDMQKQLIDWRNQEKSLLASHESDVDHLKTLVNKNAELEKDVLRLEKRQKLEREIKLLKTQVPLVKCTESRVRTEQFKESYNTEKENVQTASSNVAPIENAMKEIEREKVEANKVKNDRDKNYSQAVTAVKKINQTLNTLRADIDTKKKEVKFLEEKLPQRYKEIQYAERKIAEMEEKLRSPPDGDYSKFEEALNKLSEEYHDLQSQSVDVQDKLRNQGKLESDLRKDMDSKERALRELQNVMRVRFQKLMKDSPDTARAYEWWKENKGEFRGRVYPPVMLTMNIKDNQYAAYVENALGGSRSKILKTFIFEEKEDYQKFTRYAADRMKWKVSCSWPGELSDDLLKTPIPNDLLRSKYDMDYFVSELIEAPSYVLKTLCLENYINRYPVALRSSREQDIVNHGGFGKFAIAQTYYNVKTSAYGRRSKQTTTTVLRPAQFLNDSIDRDAENELKEKMREIEANMQQVVIDARRFGAEHDQIKQRIQELKHEREDLVMQKRDIQRAVQKYEMMKRKLEEFKGELEDMKRKPQEDERAIEELKDRINQLCNKEEVHLGQYVPALSRVPKSYEDRLIAGMQLFYMEEKYSAMRTFFRNHTTELEQAKRRLETAKREYKLAENETKKYMEECKHAGRGLPEELMDDFKAIVAQWKEGNLNLTLADLEQQIVEKEGEHAGIHFANPNAMKHYEDRKVKIRDLEGKIENNRTKLEELRSKITELKNKWSPLIYKLVKSIDVKFTAAFSRINCVGQVRVDENEDFDKWGINIYVKFRDAEKLQLLTGQRQSGGERSVTTILYLMSLQDLAKSPFRVVDEINQGMDPRNERMIHQQIVQGASRPGTSQYFLITPKLLPDLYYNERIRILCIYNSEWLPEKIKPLAEYLQSYRKALTN